MSALNTLLQYLMIFSVAYLYSKTLRGKKTSSSSMGGALDKFQTSGLKTYYAERKRAQVVKKKTTEKSRHVKAEKEPSAQTVQTSTPVPVESTFSGSTPPSPKKQSKQSSSTSQKRNPAKIVETSTTKQQEQRDYSINNSDLPISAKEAATRCQSLREMFKDVPSSEIDRVIRSVHWDVDEAATLLAQEDYTWQSVRRRRNVT
ncbi:hypothetical protein BGZ49_000593, partial [Haplosporangium sp. Z 27]